MAIHSDPTANTAIGSVSREWKQMIKRAIVLRKAGKEPTLQDRQLFTGIYRQLLNETLGELERLDEKRR